MFMIAKPLMFGHLLLVTAIRKGGLSLDNVRYDTDFGPDMRWQARKWKTRESAEKALASLVIVGGFDDYEIMDVGV